MSCVLGWTWMRKLTICLNYFEMYICSINLIFLDLVIRFLDTRSVLKLSQVHLLRFLDTKSVLKLSQVHIIRFLDTRSVLKLSQVHFISILDTRSVLNLSQVHFISIFDTRSVLKLSQVRWNRFLKKYYYLVKLWFFILNILIRKIKTSDIGFKYILFDLIRIG